MYSTEWFGSSARYLAQLEALLAGSDHVLRGYIDDYEIKLNEAIGAL